MFSFVSFFVLCFVCLSLSSGCSVHGVTQRFEVFLVLGYGLHLEISSQCAVCLWSPSSRSGVWGVLVDMGWRR
ncbi:hypothetical protein I3843_01G193900 [Carya illinoinensis]|nr:hypothetical protein I3760_05G228400 [Carya illinoinensis]KAG6670965.1 hypothetical protein I3843_Q024900 [Carya illinoinensis]KAG7997088.1 hypothetical protein I3843_01G193900 [Carya illinoinensis]